MKILKIQRTKTEKMLGTAATVVGTVGGIYLARGLFRSAACVVKSDIGFVSNVLKGHGRRRVHTTQPKGRTNISEDEILSETLDEDDE